MMENPANAFPCKRLPEADLLRNNGIKSWPKDDRPREKLLLKGPMALSDAELLAILINNGNKEKTALDLAKEMLEKVGNSLRELGSQSIKDLMQIRGIGEAKAVAIASAMELARRKVGGSILEKPVIRTSLDAANILRPLLADHRQEVFYVAFLNRSNKVNRVEIVSMGGLSGTFVDPRIIFRKALEYHAAQIILCHNHPSGNLRPSHADIGLTQKMTAAARLLEIKVMDHLIVSEEGYFSFADEGLL